MTVRYAAVCGGWWEHKEVHLGFKDCIKKKLAEDVSKSENEGTRANTYVHYCQDLLCSLYCF